MGESGWGNVGDRVEGNGTGGENDQFGVGGKVGLQGNKN